MESHDFSCGQCFGALFQPIWKILANRMLLLELEQFENIHKFTILYSQIPLGTGVAIPSARAWSNRGSRSFWGLLVFELSTFQRLQHSYGPDNWWFWVLVIVNLKSLISRKLAVPRRIWTHRWIRLEQKVLLHRSLKESVQLRFPNSGSPT